MNHCRNSRMENLVASWPPMTQRVSRPAGHFTKVKQRPSRLPESTSRSGRTCSTRAANERLFYRAPKVYSKWIESPALPRVSEWAQGVMATSLALVTWP